MAHLCVVRERGLALLAADAGGLVAAKGYAAVKLVPGVDPHRAGLERARNRIGHVEVLREDASRQTVLCVICAADHLGRQGLTSQHHASAYVHCSVSSFIEFLEQGSAFPFYGTKYCQRTASHNGTRFDKRRPLRC